MSKRRRGIFFTLSMLLLGSALLSLIFFLSQQSTKSSDTVTYLMEVDRASDKYSEAEDGLARIMSQSMNMSVQNGTVRINGSLPLGDGMAGDLDAFARFEAEYSGMNVSMNLTNIKAGRFIIQPSGAAVEASAGAFGITPQDSASSAGTLQAYDVEVIFAPGGFDGAAWQAVSNSSGDTVNAHVRVRDQGYTQVLDFRQALDRRGASLLNITKSGAAVATVGFSSPAALSVQFSGNIGLKASISFSNPSYVEADDTIRVEYAANRTGRVRIA